MSGLIEIEITKTVEDLILVGFQSKKRAVAIVSGKGRYKSSVKRTLTHRLDKKCKLLSLHPNLEERDLLI